jgi:hypothetical protein
LRKALRAKGMEIGVYKIRRLMRANGQPLSGDSYDLDASECLNISSASSNRAVHAPR